MKKVLIFLLVFGLLTGCKQNVLTIEHSQMGYTSELIGTVELNKYTSNIDVEICKENVLCVTNKNSVNILDYYEIDVQSKKIIPLEIPEVEKIEYGPYGIPLLETSEYSVFGDVIVDYENQIETSTYYIVENHSIFNKDAYKILHEEVRDYEDHVLYGELLGTYYFQSIFVYEIDDIGYFVYRDENEYVVNEISLEGYREIERISIQQDKGVLTRIETSPELYFLYRSEKKDTLVFDDEEYELIRKSNYLIFDDYILVTQYDDGLRAVSSQVYDRNSGKSQEIESLDIQNCNRFSDDRIIMFEHADDEKYYSIAILDEDVLKMIRTPFAYRSSFADSSADYDEIYLYPMNDKQVIVQLRSNTTRTIRYYLIMLDE